MKAHTAPALKSHHMELRINFEHLQCHRHCFPSALCVVIPLTCYIKVSNGNNRNKMILDHIVRWCNQWSMMGTLIWLLPGVLANQDTFFAAITMSYSIKKRPSQSYEGAILIHYEGKAWTRQRQTERKREKQKNSEIEKKKQHGAEG